MPRSDNKKLRQLRRLGFSVVLICLLSTTAAAQEISTAKKKAIVRIMGATKVPATTAALFERQVSMYGSTWADAVIADFETKGMFKNVVATDVPKVKQIIREFGEKLFSNIKLRFRSTMTSPEKLEEIMVIVYDKYLTEEELESLAAFCESTHGARVVDKTLSALADVTISYFEARGYYRVLESPEAEVKKLERFQGELALSMPEIFRATAVRARASLTPEELSEAQKLAETPTGLRLAKVFPELTRDLLAISSQVYSSQVAQLTKEVMDEQMAELEKRLREVKWKKPATKRGRKAA